MYISSFDGTKIYYTIERKSQPVLVFLHGIVSNWTVWKHEIEHFNKLGYSTLAIDLRGHGQSEAPSGKENYLTECFSKDVHNVLKKEKIDDFVLIGNSFGGVVALMYQLMFQNTPRALILCTTTYKSIINKESNFLREIIDLVFPNGEIDDYNLSETDLSRYRESTDLERAYRRLITTHLKSVVFTLEESMGKSMKPMLKNIKVPTLILSAEKDELFTPEIGQEMHRLIKGSELKLIKGATHDMVLENSQTVEVEIEEFLSKKGITPNPQSLKET